MVNESLVGEYKSAFKGQGIEFSEVREYTPGDDIRFIDWNVTARMEKPYIKVFNEERELSVTILLDLSASQKFGSFDKSKLNVSTEIAAVISYLALINNDKFGFIGFTDKIEKFIPPKKNKNNIWNIVREIFTIKPENSQTDLNKAFDYLIRTTKKRNIVFIISDFLFENNYEKLLKVVSKKHEVVAFKLYDPLEINIPEKVGFVSLKDFETGETLVLDTYNKKLLNQYSLQVKKQQQKIRSTFRKNNISYLEIDVTKDYIDLLISFFMKK